MNKILYPSFLYAFLFIASCSNPSTDSKIQLKGYHIEDGFDLEVVASEPLIASPVAMDFDNKGRLWVLEMPGYMPNIDGTGEEKAVGRILILTDKNKDGYFEESKVFLDGLVLARALKLVYGGLLYAEPPNLWFVEIDDDKPGKKTLVDPGYSIGGNVEHQANGLDLNIDNWIYSAKSSFRYRLKNGEWLKEKTSFRGQWGITHDDKGRLFYNDNSNPLYGDFVRANQLNQNPNFKNEYGENEQITSDLRVYPIRATAVNRGYIDGILDENNFLKNFTSACGPLIYRGAAFPDGFENNAFVCAPEANLIKRFILSEDQFSIEGKQAYENKEFLISEDEAFRPVNLYNGPDGAMYIVDFHHGVIQHKVYLTAYLRELYLERGLDTIVNYGRILKVTHQDAEAVELSEKSNVELLHLLSHKNGWVRDRAQQILIEKKAVDIIPDLKKLALSSTSEDGAFHALWTLEGLNDMDWNFFTEIATGNHSELISVVIQQIAVSGHYEKAEIVFQKAFEKKDQYIDWHLAMNAFKTGEKAFPLMQQLLDRHLQDTMIIEAALSNLTGYEKEFYNFLKAEKKKDNTYPIINYLEAIILKIENPVEQNKFRPITDTKTEGLKLYRQHCAACHGEDGFGIKNLAPPIYDSPYIKGNPQTLILVTLHGLQGPVNINGKRYEFNTFMPGLKDNPDLTDQDIANILSYVRNAFGNEYKEVKAEAVKAGRGKLPKGKMYTEEELEFK